MVHRQAPLSPQTPRDHTSDKTNLDFKKTTDDLGNLIAEKEAKVVQGLCSSKAKTDTAVSVQASASVPRAQLYTVGPWPCFQELFVFQALVFPLRKHIGVFPPWRSGNEPGPHP